MVDDSPMWVLAAKGMARRELMRLRPSSRNAAALVYEPIAEFSDARAAEEIVDRLESNIEQRATIRRLEDDVAALKVELDTALADREQDRVFTQHMDLCLRTLESALYDEMLAQGRYVVYVPPDALGVKGTDGGELFTVLHRRDDGGYFVAISETPQGAEEAMDEAIQGDERVRQSPFMAEDGEDGES